MTSMIIILIILILLSGFFSASETAFSSSNKIRLKYLANNGNDKAQKVLDLLENYSPLISTILIGNNIVNIVSTSLATVLFIELFKENGALISSIFMTVIVLIFGEIIPKTAAKKIPEKFALSVEPFISFLMFIFKPILFILKAVEKLIDKFFKSEDDETLSSEEFITLVEDAKEDGAFDKNEADLLTNAIEFNDQDVNDVLIPRVDVVATNIDEDTIEVERLFRESGFSRLPVYEGSIDNIIGFIHEKDFFFMYYNQESKNIKHLVKKVIYTSPHVKISALLKQLQKAKSHMAIVVDEYGGTEGIITMEDILEELVGEIYDEHDEVVEFYKKINDYIYIVKGETNIEEFFEYFSINCEEEFEFNSLSAWIIHQFDRIPKVGNSFEYDGFKIIVTKCDGKVVDEVKVVKIVKKED